MPLAQLHIDSVLSFAATLIGTTKLAQPPSAPQPPGMLFVAIYAAVVGTVSLVVAIMAYRAAGPKVTLRAVYGPRELTTSLENRLVVTAHNSGRSESTIDILAFSYLAGSGFGDEVDRRTGVRRGRRTTRRVTWEGPDVPHRIKGDDDAEWQTDLEHVRYNLGREIKPEDNAMVIVRVGTRRRMVPVMHRRLVEVWSGIDSAGRRKQLGVTPVNPSSAGGPDSQ